ncbi:MAG: DUF4338 domain-containing protein [Pseudomonadota bacterium]
MKYCGRTFNPQEIDQIRQLLANSPPSRAALARQVCALLDWRSPNGNLKQMSCRLALLRMHRDGLFALPPPRQGNGNGRPYCRRTSLAEPGMPLELPAGALTDLALEPIASRAQSHLWNEYIDRYHYLGYQPLPGAQLRYFARARGETLALLGFGAAAWKTAPRDRFIGWSASARKERLHLVVNNARFLILPWIRSKNLASRLLSMAARQLPGDWLARYGYSPVLLETFVDSERFAGTCYRAANWLCLGETQGRGKLDTHRIADLPIKTVWALPLVVDFRSRLCG